MKSFLFSFQQHQDLRSLAALRILLGIYLMYDVVLSRLPHGRLSLLWYTSIPAEESFLDPDDTPHRSPIHRIWFYRGTESFQLFLFGVTFLLGVCFAVGYKCGIFTKTLLWLNVVAMSCRCMPPHDGSDTYFRHLLLWCIQLPVSQVWSIDAYILNRRRRRKKLDETNRAAAADLSSCSFTSIDNRSAVWGIRLQIVLMYLGTVIHRTYDRYGLSWTMLKSPWLPPQLTAVHYALNSSFSPRDIWLGDIIRTTLPLSQFMTFTAILIETFAPIACLVLHEYYVPIPAFLLWNLHFGLLLLMNLPNWQFVGMFATVIWVPSWVWDGLQRRLSNRFPNRISPPKISSTSYSPSISMLTLKKKKDDIELFDTTMMTAVNDIILRDNDETTTSRSSGNKKTRKFRKRSFLSYFFLTYMLYDFAGNRGWYQKVDDGDIGEFLRFSQFWVMFSGPSPFTGHVLATGTLDGQEHVNIWEWMKSNRHDTIQVVDLNSFERHPWTNMTHVYPSPRVERAFQEMTDDRGRHKIDHFLNALCRVTPFTTVRLTVQKLNVEPPGSAQRFLKARPDAVYEVNCDGIKTN